MKYAHWSGGGYRHATWQCLRQAGYPGLLSAVLAARGVQTPEEAAACLSRDGQLPHSPLLMRDMDRAVARIDQALEQGELLAIFGDYDVDGITATTLLADYLRSRGADCRIYIPRRVEDGYGLNQEALQALKSQGVSLVVTVDCGITGVEEARFAQSIGLDLVITDHHECKDALPEAAAVVDPRREDCPYPFKHLAGVGVALKLVLALGREQGGTEQEEALFRRYCPLAAVGTVADVMEMTGENRIIVRQGLTALPYTEFVGLRALLRETGLDEGEITSIQAGFVLAPRLNAAGRMGEAELAVRLLLCEDFAQAMSLAQELCQLNRNRQSVEQQIFAEAVEQIERLDTEERHALVLASGVWHQGVIGIVASRISERYGCPCFMIHLQDGMGKGSCRSYGGFNLFAALESAGSLLEDFGGHELAAGFTIREGNIPAFRQAMNRCVKEYWHGETPKATLSLDVALQYPQRLTLEEVGALGRLEPYGPGNERPVFALLGATLEGAQNVGQNRHMRLRLRQGNCVLDGIFFSMNMETAGVSNGNLVDAAFYLQIHAYRGYTNIQMQLMDIRPAGYLSRRERDDLTLVDRLAGGWTPGEIEARRLLPERGQFEALWRGIMLAEREGLCGKCLWVTLLRRLQLYLAGEETFLRTAMGLAVFEERGLLRLERDGAYRTLRLLPGHKANLEECPYVARLRGCLPPVLPIE